MKSPRAEFREHWLLLKSAGCVIIVTAAVLLLLRHAAPVEKNDKFFGGGVSLLLARTPEDVNDFRRWTQLNDPSHIFGYRSAGIFSRAVSRERVVELPAVRLYTGEGMETALYLPAARKDMPLEMEKSSVPVSVTRVNQPVEKRALVSKGIPVFDEKGEIVARLENISGANKVNALLIRAGKNAAGTDFRIIESSGDRNFDRSVTLALERTARKGTLLEGVLAVWPESSKKVLK